MGVVQILPLPQRQETSLLSGGKLQHYERVTFRGII